MIKVGLFFGLVVVLLRLSIMMMVILRWESDVG